MRYEWDMNGIIHINYHKCNQQYELVMWYPEGIRPKCSIPGMISYQRRWERDPLDLGPSRVTQIQLAR